MTVVCGDSHTSTHGAFGALAFGVGTSEVEHVLATQCLPRLRPRTMRIRLPRRPAAGGHSERHDPRHDRQDRGRRGGRTRSRVRRRRHPAAVHGRAADDLQHVDRGGCARRDDRARRHDLRLPRGSPRCARGRRLGAGARPLALAPNRRRSGLRPRGRDRRLGARASGDLGDEPGHGRPHRRRRSGPRRLRRPGRARGRRASARVHGARARGRRCRTFTSTASSSAPARMPESRTCARPPRSRPAGASARESGRWSFPARPP